MAYTHKFVDVDGDEYEFLITNQEAKRILEDLEDEDFDSDNELVDVEDDDEDFD